MKKTFCGIMMIILTVLLVYVYTSTATAIPGGKPEVSLWDSLERPPNSVSEKYGYSRENVLLYNIARLRGACREYEGRIKTLEEKVAELDAPIVFDDEPVDNSEEAEK